LGSRKERDGDLVLDNKRVCFEQNVAFGAFCFIIFFLIFGRTFGLKADKSMILLATKLDGLLPDFDNAFGL